MNKNDEDQGSFEEVLNDEYVSWYSYLSPSPGYVPLLAVSTGVTVVIFAVGYLLAAVGNNAGEYLSSPILYPIAGIIFGTLAWIGWADQVYVGVWNDVRPAFAVDDETYRAVIQPWIERNHDERRILGWALIGVPYVIAFTLVYFPEHPLHETAKKIFFFGSEISSESLDLGMSSLLISYLFSIVVLLGFATIFNIFANHLALTREISKLPFRDIYTTATELEPVARFTMTSATAWFAIVSIFALYQGLFPGTGVSFIVLLLLVLVGIGVFFSPQLFLHRALLDAKRSKVTSIQKEYEEIHRSIEQENGSSEDLSLCLEVTDRRLENAKSIRTWPYDILSVGKLAAASLIPWLTLSQKILALPIGS